MLWKYYSHVVTGEVAYISDVWSAVMLVICCAVLDVTATGEATEGEDTAKEEKDDEDEGEGKDEVGEEEAKPGRGRTGWERNQKRAQTLNIIVLDSDWTIYVHCKSYIEL